MELISTLVAATSKTQQKIRFRPSLPSKKIGSVSSEFYARNNSFKIDFRLGLQSVTLPISPHEKISFSIDEVLMNNNTQGTSPTHQKKTSGYEEFNVDIKNLSCNSKTLYNNLSVVSDIISQTSLHNKVYLRTISNEDIPL